MSLDRKLTNYHEAYAEADPAFQKVIDEAFSAACAVLISYRWPINNSDPAEDLISAIVKFAVISAALDLNGGPLKPPTK